MKKESDGSLICTEEFDYFVQSLLDSYAYRQRMKSARLLKEWPSGPTLKELTREMTANIKMLLIRGLPGSGKTTMAKKYAETGYVHCEADQYFEVGGEYRFDGSKLGAAHNDCLRRAVAAMDAGLPVVVANTFTRRWEMEPYLEAAKKRGINVRIIEATGNWPNVHGVPADAIERMRKRWETIVEGEQQ